MSELTNFILPLHRIYTPRK